MDAGEAVNRILRVDHAGERGAICIYEAQLFVSKLLYPSITGSLTEMLAHERRHFQVFNALLQSRGVRHCYALTLWAAGGAILGFLTALAGVRAIWVCTAAIESTVNQHLAHQVAFLKQYDSEALAAVESIRREEEAHETHALRNGGHGGGLYRLLRWLVCGATSFAIWLSTKL